MSDTLKFDVIDHIEKVRAKNNKNWMDILRLAYRLNPDETKKIVKEIVEYDRQISSLLEKFIA